MEQISKMVFAPLVEDPILQMHLALKPGQRVESQWSPPARIERVFIN